MTEVDIISSLWKNHKQIERIKNVSQEEFISKYITSNNHNGCPVIITDATKNWPALKKWTFDYFRENFGDLEIMCWYVDFKSRPVRRWYYWTKLAYYIDYIFKNPNQQPIESPPEKRYVSPRFPNITEHDRQPWPLPPENRLYCAELMRRPELYTLFSDFDMRLYFVDDLFQQMPGEWSKFMLFMHYPALFLGPSGTHTGFHCDFWNAETVFFNFVGRKHYVCFPPENIKQLIDANQIPINPREPDFNRYPDSMNLTAYHAVMEPGDCIFMPPNWVHDVLALSPSISLTWSICTLYNFGNFMPHLLMANKQVADILAINPKFQQSVVNPVIRPFVRTTY
jgi:hypothetical protein